jgi:hypothetical protein
MPNLEQLNNGVFCLFVFNKENYVLSVEETGGPGENKPPTSRKSLTNFIT